MICFFFQKNSGIALLKRKNDTFVTEVYCINIRSNKAPYTNKLLSALSLQLHPTKLANHFVQINQFSMKQITLLSEAFKNLKTVGTITFSSKFLVNDIIAPVDFAKARCIVELGAGDGCITKALLAKMRPDAILISFEINDKFCDIIRKDINDSRLHLICDSAEKIGEYLKQNGFEKADFIVSSVPLVVLPKPIARNIEQEVRNTLAVGGAFVHLSYSPLQLKKFEKMFSSVQLHFTLLNVPPAFVYICRQAA